MRVVIATQPRLDCRKPNGGRTGNPEVKAIDWNDSSDRKWLMSHLHWAMHNGQEVRLIGPELESR
jgi:hypothetical protein